MRCVHVFVCVCVYNKVQRFYRRVTSEAHLETGTQTERRNTERPKHGNTSWAGQTGKIKRNIGKQWKGNGQTRERERRRENKKRKEWQRSIGRGVEKERDWPEKMKKCPLICSLTGELELISGKSECGCHAMKCVCKHKGQVHGCLNFVCLHLCSWRHVRGGWGAQIIRLID